MATRSKSKKKARPPRGRSTVDHLEVQGGRRNAKGEMMPLFVRLVCDHDGAVSATLGSAFDKLQIRVTLNALRAIVKKMESLA